MIVCQICGREFKNIQSLSRHIKLEHNIENKQEYYDCYMKKPNEGFCKLCSKPTHFQNMDRGYTQYCSKYCRVKAQGNGAKIDHNEMWTIRKNKIEQYEKEHNCINLGNAVSKYGRILYKAIAELHIPINRESQMYQYIDNSYLTTIENFINNYKRNSGISKPEKTILSKIQYNGEILENDKTEIYPLELDLYIPELKLAIEYNGTWHHSIEAGKPEEYHLNKSLCCREKGIRLIHIYEFENLDTQIDLINNLIQGIDNYPKNDFNKNNLIKNIPIPELIHISNRDYHVYGAGKLY